MPYTLKERLGYTTAGFALLGMVVIYALELSWFNRTIGMQRLALFSLAGGAFAGLALGHRFAQREYGLTEKIQIYIFFGLSCTIFGPLFGSLSNRLLSPPSTPAPVEFISQTARYASRSGPLTGEKAAPNLYAIEFYYRQDIRQITSLTPITAPEARGDTIWLNMLPGLWGFEVVQKKAAAK